MNCRWFNGSKVTLLAIMVSLFSFSAKAQAVFPLNAELPTMGVVICADLAGSVEMAGLLKRQGLEPLLSRARRNEALQARPQSCEFMNLAVMPRRKVSGIEPYMTWVTTYVPGSDTTFRVAREGKVYDIPYRITLQRAMFYEAEVHDAISDDRYSAYVQIPDRPWLLEYFRDNTQR